MTSDAKIGLLLGLVFIFIIAFVVNGLPRLRAEPDSNELTIISAEDVVSSENVAPGLAARERNVEEVFNTWAPSEQNPPRESVRSTDDRQQQQTGDAVATEDDKLRYQVSLPQVLPTSTDELLSFGSRGEPYEPSWLVSNATRQAPSVRTGDRSHLLETFIGGKRVNVSPASAVVNSQRPRDTSPEKRRRNHPRPQPSQTDSSPPMVVRPEAPKPEHTTTVVLKPAGRKSQWPKEYVVEGGDNLAVIAKKFYGEEEGNRRVNIDVIFKANNKALESPDKIKVGQKLRIPALSGTSVKQQASIFPESLVSRVKSMTRPKPKPKTPPKPLVVAPGRFYVAKDGDSLWKIADAQLGKGHRYAEIFKLNNDIMKDPANVVPGMRLRMPAN